MTKILQDSFFQCLCLNGHYFEYFYDADVSLAKCPICKERSEWTNFVDESSGHPNGLYPVDCLSVKKEYDPCPTCKRIGATSYIPPTEAEMLLNRRYFNEKD